MNLHEYQGKSILRSFGVNVPVEMVADTPEKAVEAAREIESETGRSGWVIKAQIHAGGRGKGGGVKLAKTLDEVLEISKKMIGMQLV
ncbi:MAG: succinate--CoA ligase subunit beta, partial [Bacteroidales bacterium]|nr:succinate--CoA ligase subunit beta [Bacteroidales bacterium]